jgi:peptide deformylase
MSHTIYKMGHPIVMTPARRVNPAEFNTPQLQTLIDDLFAAQRHFKGVGIAAPQIGVAMQVAVLGFEKNSRYPNKSPIANTVLINPEVEHLTDEKVEDWEGCLSVPGLRAPVLRAVHIRCRYQDVTGQHHELEAHDFHARVIQHEVDHLAGIVYPARIVDFTKFGFEDSLPEYAYLRESPEVIVSYVD